VKKTLSLEENVPASGCVRHLFLCLSALLRLSMRAMKDAEKKDFPLRRAIPTDRSSSIVSTRGSRSATDDGKRGSGVPDFQAQRALRERRGVAYRYGNAGRMRGSSPVERKDEINDIQIKFRLHRVHLPRIEHPAAIRSVAGGNRRSTRAGERCNGER